MLRMLTIILAACQLLPACFGYSSGPPERACFTRTPSHGVAPQKGECPFTVVAQYWKPGQPTDIIIQENLPARNLTFKGFLLSVALPDGTIIGSMNTTAVDPDTAKVGEACRGTSLSHIDPTPKQSVQLEWTAPADLDTKLRVETRLVLVEDKQTFYTECSRMSIESDPSVRVKGKP